MKESKKWFNYRFGRTTVIALIMKINKEKIISGIEKAYLKKNIVSVDVGDTVKIGVLIQEGSKERIQFSEGVVICMHKAGLSTTITLRRIFQGVGIERVYLIHSPRITSIHILRKSKVKRAKLYYLRHKTGKAARLKQRFSY